MPSSPLGDPISALTEVSAIDGTETVAVVQSTRTKRSLLSTIAEYVVRTASSFVQSGTGGIATDLQSRGRQQVFLWDFLSAAQRTEASTDAIPSSDMKAAFQSAVDNLIARGGGDLWACGLRIRFNSGAVGVVVNGNSDASNDSIVVRLQMAGTRVYHYGTGGAFQFLDTDHCKLVGEPHIFLDQDLSTVYGVHLKHSRWGRYDVAVYNGTTHVGPSFAANNRAFYLESGPSDTFDNIYNRCKGRVRRTGWAIYLSNADTTASRNNSNEFDLRYGSTNGIRIEGCVGNTFKGSLETGTGIPIALKNNGSSLPSRFNTFDFEWVEASTYAAWSPEADSGCDNNTLVIRNDQFGTLNLPGEQNIERTGNQGTGTGLSRQVENQEVFEGAMWAMASKNWLLGSEQFDNANWTKTNCTASAADAITGPNGSASAETLTLTAANGGAAQGVTTVNADVNGVRWTGSVWLKHGTAHTARIQISISGQSFTRYVYVTPEWKRYWVTGKFTSNATTVTMTILPADLDVATGAVDAWGACLHKGYIGRYAPNGTNATPTDVGALGSVSRNPAMYPAYYFNKRWSDGVFINNYRKIGYAASAPSTGTHEVGDVMLNTNPAAGGANGWVCTVGGTPGTWVEFGTVKLQGSATYDPASLADGEGATTTVTVTGAALGNFAIASFSLDLQGITLTAYVSATNTVTVRFQNESGGVLDLGSGTLRARVIAH